MIARLTLLAGTAGLALLSTPALAQKTDEAWTLHQALGAPDNLKISGSVRARYEALDGQFRPGLDETDDAFLLRTTLFAEYDTGPVRIGAELYDSRAYAVDSGSAVSANEVNTLELVQAYVAIDLGDALGDGSDTSLTAGRFLLDLGSRRLVAKNNFRNTTNAFTGARFDWSGKADEQLTLFYTLPQTRLPSDKASVLDNEVEFDRESWDLRLWGAYLAKPKLVGDLNLELYVYGLDERDSARTATRNRHIVTPGARLFVDPAPGAVDVELEGGYQLGRIRASSAAGAAELDVAAHFVHAEVGYTFAGDWSPRVAIEYDLGSGDDPESGSFNRFDNLFGARRPDFGPSSLYGPLGRSNISSPGVRVEVKPDKRWDGFLFYRAAWLDSATDSFASTGIRDATGSSGKFGGHQIEGRARYWIVPKLLRLDAGGAVLLNGRFLDNAPNASGNGNTTYGYVDITATF